MRSLILASAALLCVAGNVYGEENSTQPLPKMRASALKSKGVGNSQADMTDFVATYTTGSKAIATNGTVICNMRDSQTPDVGNAITVDSTTGVYKINTPGYYMINFGVSPKFGRARFAMFKNNTPVTGATLGCVDGNGQMITLSTILWLTRNTELKLVNISGASVALENGGSLADPCAFVNIVKIRSQH